MEQSVTKEQADALARALGATQTQIDSLRGKFTDSTPTPAEKDDPYGFQVDGNFVPFRNDQQATEGGYYGSGSSERVQTISSEGSYEKAKSFGLTGIADKAFEGLTYAQADAKGKELQAKYKSQSSALTSSIYNPSVISGSKNAVDNMMLGLDSTTEDPFKTKEDKQNSKDVLLESTSKELASLFQTQPQLMQSYQQNPAIKEIIDKYVGAGGTLGQIAGKMQEPVMQQQGEQSTPDFLSSLETNTNANVLEQLAPEKAVTQADIMRAAQVPQQYNDLYFGSESRIGFLKQQQDQAEEQKKIIERKAENQKADLKAQADYAIQKNTVDMQYNQATVEKNRLTAKNYVTAHLAKLGALKTTGAAIEGLGSLEQKYQEQKMKLESDNKFYTQAIQIKLTDAINTTETDRDEDILTISKDLTKSEQDVRKEIMKLQNTAQKDILDSTGKYATLLRTQNEKYKKQMENAAKDNIGEFQKTVEAFSITPFNRITGSGFSIKNTTGGTDYGAVINKGNLQSVVSQVVGKGILSSITEKVLTGESNIGDYSEKNQTKITEELRAIGIGPDELQQTRGDVTTSSGTKTTASGTGSLIADLEAMLNQEN